MICSNTILKDLFPSNWMTRIVFQMKRILFIQNSLVIQAALENYCLKNGIHLEYISNINQSLFYWMEKQNILPKHNLSADDFILDTL